VVATNAHVVAGQEDTTVTTSDGAELDATAIHFDPRNDFALLQVDGYAGEPLALAPQAEEGTEAAVLGYPEDGPYTVTPARIGTTAEVVSQDAYGRGPVRRQMTAFRAGVRSGNSGGPVVDPAGSVQTTVFAASTDGRTPSGLGVPNDVARRALDRPDEPVDTGPCVV
jgi:S1-C subfamily serine protease